MIESLAIVWTLCLLVLSARAVARFEARFTKCRLRYVPRMGAFLMLLACLMLAAEVTGLISVLGSDSDVPHA